MIIVNYFCMDSKDILLEEIAEEALACAYRFRKVVGGGIGGVIIQGGGEQRKGFVSRFDFADIFRREGGDATSSRGGFRFFSRGFGFSRRFA